MTRRRLLMASLLILGLCTCGQTYLSDPYEILRRHYEAIGGLERLKAIESSYSEATMTVEGICSDGRVLVWRRGPLQFREETTCGGLTAVSGDDGVHRWSLSDGEPVLLLDEETLRERQVKRLVAQWDHLNRNSDVFSLWIVGWDRLLGTDLYVVELTDNITSDTIRTYYDMETFYERIVIKFSSERILKDIYSDFREVDGIVFAFRAETEMLPENVKSVIQFERIAINLPIPDSVFKIPSRGAVGCGSVPPEAPNTADEELEQGDT